MILKSYDHFNLNISFYQMRKILHKKETCAESIFVSREMVEKQLTEAVQPVKIRRFNK